MLRQASPSIPILVALVLCSLILFPFTNTQGQGTHGRTDVRTSVPTGSFTPAPNAFLFNPATFPAGGTYSFSVTGGDFNHDGKPDLVIANECPLSTCTSGAVSVLLGNGDGTFQAAQSYPSGGFEAYSVFVADVNGDGKQDLIVANGCQSVTQCANGAIGVLLGNGDGTFQAAQSYPSGGLAATSVVVVDVNGDGKPDLIVANQCLTSSCTSGGVSVLLGNGNGTFQAAQSYASGGTVAMAVTVGDFNGDKKADLAVVNQCQSATDCSGNVGVLLGNGNGTFQPAKTYDSGGYQAAALAISDVNGDKKVDLVVANQCSSSTSCANGNVGVLLGNGDGTFQTAKPYASGGNITADVAARDLNGDGNIDLVLANKCQVQNNCNLGSVSILLGNGDGTFQPPQNYFSDGVFAVSVGVGDVNGDGKLDLAVVNQCQSSTSCNGSVTVLLGKGDGTFQAPPSYAAGGYADSVVAADMNGDGKLDLVVASLCPNASCNDGSHGRVGILLGNGDGTFKPVQAYTTAGFGSSAVAVGDLNGDGKPDVVVANQCSTVDCLSGGSVSVFLGNGDGTLQAAQTYASGGFTALSLALADFNKDGHLDIVVANQCQDATCLHGNVGVLLGTGTGTFQPVQTYSSAGYKTAAVAVGDFNADGNPDLVVVNQCQDNTCVTGGVSVLLGNGDGTFQAAQTYSSVGAQADGVVVADVNGDGRPDLVVSNLCRTKPDCSTGAIASLIGKGNGTFFGGNRYITGAPGTYSLAAADFNGDGITDVVVAGGGQTSLMIGKGDGSFWVGIPYYPGGLFVSSGDFNGDGKPDAVVAEGALTEVTVLSNITAGYRWSTTTAVTSSVNPSVVFQSVVLTATITPQFGGPPTGTVRFMNGTTVIGQSAVINGQATLNYAFTSPGTFGITANYSGDPSFMPSSGGVKQTVNKATTTTALTSSPNPSSSGQTVTFTATVSGQYGGAPTGLISFKMNGTVIGTAQLSGGVAQFQTSTLAKGQHQVVAAYPGDSNFYSSSGSVVQTVQ